MSARKLFSLVVSSVLFASTGHAQQPLPSKVDIAFNRYYPYDEVLDILKRIQAAYPDLVKLESIGQSLEGRDLVVATLTNQKIGNELDKPAMWIDANVHGNEIQGTEVVLYTAHFLTRAYGQIDEITKLLDAKVIYLLPSQNPDGRTYWFEAPNNSSSSRAGVRPVDSDDDGLFDEDPPNDLDGDGSITMMWKADPDGDFVRDEEDPRNFRRARKGETQRYRMAGMEGIDDDGDGQVNEDGKGGDDLNRNWPSDWQPNHVQFGAALYPLSQPEPRAIAAFILSRPNIAGVQSYHNAGGMILRGPGADYLDGTYPQADVAVYDELGKLGERMLPYYRYMVIWKDLYTVHGGFVNWTAEQLGILSFTNELWNDSKMYQRDGASQESDEALTRDRMLLGQAFKDYAEFEHPTLGKVLIGGDNKWGSRVTPAFLLEEECHRNFAFTMAHADAMPMLSWKRNEAKPLGNGLYAVTVQIENEKSIPTRMRIAVDRKIGAPDLLTVEPASAVVSGGTISRFDDTSFDPVRYEPARLVLEDGVGSKAKRSFRFLVRGKPGDELKFRYLAEKATDREFALRLP